jgi:hypothetical protein
MSAMLTNRAVNGCYLEVEGPWTSPLVELFELTESLLSLLSRAFFSLSMYSCCDLANTCARMPSSHSFRPGDKRTNCLIIHYQKNVNMQESHNLLTPLQHRFNFCEQFLKDKRKFGFVHMKHTQISADLTLMWLNLLNCIFNNMLPQSTLQDKDVCACIRSNNTTHTVHTE